MAEEIWEHSRSDDDARVGPPLERDPSRSLTSSASSYTNRQRKRDLRLWQATTALATNRQGGWLLRQLKGKRRTTPELVIDEVLMSIDGIDKQDQASKISFFASGRQRRWVHICELRCRQRLLLYHTDALPSFHEQRAPGSERLSR